MNKQITDALRQVIDPELGINIVDLGLVYHAEMEKGQVRVAMTLTTPGCPLAQRLTEMAEAAIWQHVPGVEAVEVQLVWTPPWNPAMMSATARERLGYHREREE